MDYNSTQSNAIFLPPTATLLCHLWGETTRLHSLGEVVPKEPIEIAAGGKSRACETYVNWMETMGILHKLAGRLIYVNWWEMPTADSWNKYMMLQF